MPSFHLSEFDVFFLSYDEPNADKHYADLCEKAPWSKRVHGVKGFDAAHRACAERSETDWFVTVDADNIVRPEFFDEMVDFDPVATPNRCFSWNGVNMINGLMYGNGGLKLWSKNFVLNMNSHENADDPRKAVDFCWEDDYKQVHKTFSEVWVNGSPYQAFRVGYREAVKLTLDRGGRVDPERMKKQLHPVNLRNARIWSCVGSDFDNGMFAMLGTRMGWAQMCDLNWDYTPIRDYDWFQGLWSGVVDMLGGEAAMKNASRHGAPQGLMGDLLAQYGSEVSKQTKIALPILSADESEFFRESFRLRND
jgi:hypothetical protein